MVWVAQVACTANRSGLFTHNVLYIDPMTPVTSAYKTHATHRVACVGAYSLFLIAQVLKPKMA